MDTFLKPHLHFQVAKNAPLLLSHSLKKPKLPKKQINYDKRRRTMVNIVAIATDSPVSS